MRIRLHFWRDGGVPSRAQIHSHLNTRARFLRADALYTRAHGAASRTPQIQQDCQVIALKLERKAEKFDEAAERYAR